MHTITLELLRHGPAHNQLLSPLTPYLALCENHRAVTIHVPFEHNQFLHRLDALGYGVSDEARIFQLKDTAAVLGEMLGSVPGLTAESNKQNSLAEPLTPSAIDHLGLGTGPAALRTRAFAGWTAGRRRRLAASAADAGLSDPRGAPHPRR